MKKKSDDHLHCCPNGYTCDAEHSRCQKGLDKSDDVLCPGGMFTRFIYDLIQINSFRWNVLYWWLEDLILK